MTQAQDNEDEDLGENIEPKFNFGEYPSDFFDFIIIDECHRGGANDESSWRAIMDYFSPAVQLGLTATPKRDVNGDTYKYFGDPPRSELNKSKRITTNTPLRQMM